MILGSYSVKKFSALTGISSATIRYYDSVGLLKPARKTSHLHRRYTQADIAKLQQITTLRYLGFSIEQMKQILSDQSLDIRQSLRVQIMIMREKIKHLDEAAQLSESLLASLEQHELIDWQIQAKVIQALKLQDTESNDWYKTFLTPKEAKELNAIAKERPREYWHAYQARWAALFNDIAANLASDPESEMGQAFAKRWFDLVNEVYAGNRALGNKLWEGYKAGVITDSPLRYNQAVIDYMAKAKKKYLEETV